MLFPLMYSKLGHKHTNVKTASINKVLIAFVHRITLRKHLYSQGLYAESVCAIIPKLDYNYCVVFHALSSDVQYFSAHARKRKCRKD